MSQENVELVRRTLEAVSDRDADVLSSYIAADMEWEPAGPAAVEGAFYRGRVEVTGAMAEIWKTWEVFRFEETQVRDLGESILWLGRVHVKGSASHLELDQEFANHVEVRDGKVVRARAFLAWREAFEALGLGE
jgi:ketosteroid isomerase-like protein